MRWHATSAGDVGQALLALTVAVGIEALLHTMPLPKLCRTLGIRVQPDASPGSESSSEPGRSAQVLRVAHAVRRAYTKGPLPDSCLRRCLCAGFLLRRFQPRLVLGVRNQPQLEAHAWLELHGTVLDWNPLHDEFSPLT